MIRDPRAMAKAKIWKGLEGLKPYENSPEGGSTDRCDGANAVAGGGGSARKSAIDNL
jgi:hypothetical protein